MKELLQNKLAIPLLALAIVGVGGSAYTLQHAGPATVHAQSPVVSQSVAQPKNSAVDVLENATDKPDATSTQNPSYTASIKTQDSQEVSDATESQQLTSLAKISPAQAKVAAEKYTTGTVSNVKLENNNGNVVYTVTIGTKEVTVDAGNGAILQTEADTSEGAN